MLQQKWVSAAFNPRVKVGGMFDKLFHCRSCVGSTAVGLMPCAAAANDALAMWELGANGALSNAGSRMCLGKADGKGSIAMVSCSASAGIWEFTASGQLNLASESLCATAAGYGDSHDAALHGSAVASSNANAAHGKFTFDQSGS